MTLCRRSIRAVRYAVVPASLLALAVIVFAAAPAARAGHIGCGQVLGPDGVFVLDTRNQACIQ